jgi:acetyltransferase-like isoleucine patch superfamily enzyme
MVRWICHWPGWAMRGNRVAFTASVAPRVFLLGSRVGRYTYLGHDAFLIHAQTGNYCSIAAGAKIGGMEHAWWWGSTSPSLSRQCVAGKPTLIEDDVWIGANAVVRQGIRIGRGAVVGAGAVVLGDVAPYSMVAGVPAREIRKRFNDAMISEIASTCFWDFPPEEAFRRLEKLRFPEAPAGNE